MRRSLRLRRWQKDALERFEASAARDYLAVATPGAGKTTFALTAALRDLGRYPHRRIVVVTPTQHLKQQWADAASGFGLQLEPSWQPAGGFPGDMHGIAVTYQQVASTSAVLAQACDDAFVVLDEIHHAGTDRAWGTTVGEAFSTAARRLALSGTPFRSDDDPIPFVRYEHDDAVADFVYDYGQALADGGVVRPVFFPAVGGEMEWATPEGATVSATFDDPLDRVGASQRLRTALSAEGDWLPEVLVRADDRLTRLRRAQPDAGALAIAMDVGHAHRIRDLLRRRGSEPVVATSDDPSASERIEEFAHGTDPWIVAVRMVSEGVDIPRLRVGVYATNVVTELFFRQAVGRLVRWQGQPRHQKAFMFVPDDVRLRWHAHQIAQQRTHSLRRHESDLPAAPVGVDDAGAGEADQLSLFRAISATPLDGSTDPGVFEDGDPGDPVHDPADDPALEIELLPPPPLVSCGPTLVVNRARRKRELRRANADRVRMICRLSGLTPEVVNARLNDEAAVGSVAEADLRALERRLTAADRWIDVL